MPIGLTEFHIKLLKKFDDKLERIIACTLVRMTDEKRINLINKLKKDTINKIISLNIYIGEKEYLIKHVIKQTVLAMPSNIEMYNDMLCDCGLRLRQNKNKI